MIDLIEAEKKCTTEPEYSNKRLLRFALNDSKYYC